MAAKVVAVLALVVVAASWGAMDREMYDDTSGDMKLMDPEQSYVDSAEEPVSTRQFLTRNNYATKWPRRMQTKTVFEPSRNIDYMTKRSAAGDKARSRLLRWNIKKGKAGSHMICYFKLCSFQPFS